MKTEGYKTKKHAVQVKRYCQTMDLKNDEALISQYKKIHRDGVIWKEVIEGIKAVGILEMEIYIHGNRLFMIVETPVDFDWDLAMKQLASLPRQEEWEHFVSVFQQCRETDSSDEKWKMMDRMFYLYE